MQADHNATPLRVLLAEDNEVNHFFVRRCLETHGHTVVGCTNGAEALRAFEKEAFDIILMDLQMPHMDGVEASSAIRKLEAEGARRVPIVALTADDTPETVDRCKQIGIDAYLLKPILPAQLHDLLQRLTSGDTMAQLPASLAAVDEDTRYRVIEIFYKESSKQLLELQFAAAQKDAVGLRHAAHSLKGAATLFEAARLKIAARVLESMGHSGDFKNVNERVLELESALQELCASLQGWRARTITDPLRKRDAI